MKHNDSFMLMKYDCQKCGFSEMIWNSRDNVSPFSVNCPKCDGGMYHTDWSKDRRIPDYVPPAGSRYFADFTKDRAEDLAKKRIAAFTGTEFELSPGTERYDEVYHSLFDSFMNDACSMDILTEGTK